MLTTKTLYSLVIIADIAKNSPKGPVRLADVSSRQKLSLHYLDQLARKLRMAGIIESVRGPGGGYVTGKNFDKKTVKDIMSACGEKILDKNRNSLDSKSVESGVAQGILKQFNQSVINSSSDMLLCNLAV